MSIYFIQAYFNKNLGDDLMVKILTDKIVEADNKSCIIKIKGGHDIFSKIKAMYNILKIPFFF